MNQVICENFAKLPPQLVLLVSELTEDKLSQDEHLAALLAKNGLVQTSAGLKALSGNSILLKEAITHYNKVEDAYLIDLMASDIAKNDKHLSRQLMLKISDTAALTSLFKERQDISALQKLLKFKSGVTLDQVYVQEHAAACPKLAYYWTLRLSGRKLPQEVYDWTQNML